MALGFWMNNKNCYGCKTCSIACKSEKQLNEGVLLRKVSCIRQDSPVNVSFLSMSCNHCEDPACVKHCPTHAMHKDAETGLVLVDQDRCIACGYCTWTCPYGAPSMDDVHHIMSKCTFCKDRISEGQKPFCAEACPANARVFGDLNDPESEPSKLLQQKKGVQYLPEMGTNPSVYYV